MKKHSAKSKPSRKPAPRQTPRSPVADPQTAARFSAALTAHQGGRLAEAEAGYREVLRRDPKHPHALNNMAVLMRSFRRLEDALVLYRQAQAASPEDPHVYSNCGCVLVDLGRLTDAEAVLRRSIALRPDVSDPVFNLANCRRDARDKDGAMTLYDRAIRIRPAMAEPHAARGDLLKERGELGRAVDGYVTALKLRPGMMEPYNNLGEALKEQGRLEEAIAIFQEGMKHHPNNALIHGNLLFALHYTNAVPPDTLFKAHQIWGERHARPLLPAAPHFANPRDPDRRLRVGYVSPDFCTHSCAYFSEPLLAAHDRSAIEIVCYPTSAREDGYTGRFRQLADRWRPLVNVDDAAAAEMVRADGIDILVDLAGHTGENRLMTFARKPAPIQVNWLGYPDTTGMAAMDYRLTDAVADPVGAADGWATERLIRLDDCFLAFKPVIVAAPGVAPPSAAAGHITFGSFNNISKVTPQVVGIWSEILKNVPGSRLILKSKALGDAPTKARYGAMLVQSGISPDRFDLLTRIEPVTNHLRAYDHVDIGLDPFPYNGTTTTCEALWMGVPVVGLAGSHHVARVGASLLTAVGLPDLIAGSPAEYVDIAVKLAGDRDRLGELRRTMRSRLESSPLTDYTGFTRKVEAAYRAMWRDWLGRTVA